MKTSRPEKALWETLVIAGSFGGVWIYFFAWLAAGRANTPLSPLWQFLLLPCLFALFIVFKRRLQRARSTLRSDDGDNTKNQFPPGFPFGAPNQTGIGKNEVSNTKHRRHKTP